MFAQALDSLHLPVLYSGPKAAQRRANLPVCVCVCLCVFIRGRERESLVVDSYLSLFVLQ